MNPILFRSYRPKIILLQKFQFEKKEKKITKIFCKIKIDILITNKLILFKFDLFVVVIIFLNSCLYIFDYFLQQQYALFHS